jgi:hypothetical protein
VGRIPYTGEGSAFRRLLNHSPAVADAYWSLRKALDVGVLPPKIRMLSFLVTDVTNRCRY